MNNNAEQLFKTPNEDPFWIEEHVDSKIYEQNNLNIVEQSIKTCMRKITNTGDFIRKCCRVTNVEQSLETIIFDIFKNPSISFGGIKRMPGQITFKTHLQRNLLCEINFKNVEFQPCYMNPTSIKKLHIDDKFLPYYNEINASLEQTDLSTLNEQEKRSMKRLRYCLQNDCPKEFTSQSSNLVSQVLDFIESIIEVYCKAANKLIETQKTDHLKLFCFASLHKTFIDGIRVIADDFLWLDKLVNTEYAKNFPNEPKHPTFGVWKLALKIWNRTVLNQNFDKLFEVSSTMINLLRCSKFEKQNLLSKYDRKVQQSQKLKDQIMNELESNEKDFNEELINSISVFYDAVLDRNLNEVTFYMVNSMD